MIHDYGLRTLSILVEKSLDCYFGLPCRTHPALASAGGGERSQVQILSPR